MGEAGEHWAASLAGWRVPDHLADVPHAGFDVARFAARAELAVDLDTPSRRVAIEALPVGGSVLDIGCGAGAGSLPLVPPAARLIGVDAQASMLDAYAPRARARGADVTTVYGTWPDVRHAVPTVDVTVAHHVAYGIADLAGFADSARDRTRHRVVLELSERHPLHWMRVFWRAVHGIDRPDGPTAHDAVAALRESGVPVQAQRWEEPTSRVPETEEQRLSFLRARLRIGHEHDDLLRALLVDHPRPTQRTAVTLWWDTA